MKSNFVAYERRQRKIGYKNDELKISAPIQNEKRKKRKKKKFEVINDSYSLQTINRYFQ